MKNRIASVALLALLLQGCFSSSNSTSDNNSSRISNNLKSLGLAFAGKDNMLTTVGGGISSSTSSTNSSSSSSLKMKYYQKENISSCENGGTMNIVSDFDNQNIHTDLPIDFNSTIIMDNCIEDGININATIFRNIKNKGNYLSKITMIFTEDSSLEDINSGEIITIKKNSKVSIDELSEDTEIDTENMDIQSSTGESYKSINLVTNETYLDNGDESSYDMSGEIIYNGEKYSVDRDYDGSKTPTIYRYDEDGIGEHVLSGQAKYYNQQGEHITFTIISENSMKISIDSDNDGKIDKEETISLD